MKFYNMPKIRKRFVDLLELDMEPARIAAGLSVGVFIGITPFYGLHTILAIGLAFIFKLSKLATVTGAWLNAPWFAPFIYAFSYGIGAWILDTNPFEFDFASMKGQSLRWLADFLVTAGLPLLIGTSILGIFASLLTFLVSWPLLKKLKGRDLVKGAL